MCATQRTQRHHSNVANGSNVLIRPTFSHRIVPASTVPGTASSTLVASKVNLIDLPAVCTDPNGGGIFRLNVDAAMSLIIIPLTQLC